MSNAPPPSLPPTEPRQPIEPEPTAGRATTALLDQPVRPRKRPSSRRRPTTAVVVTVLAVLALIVVAAVGYWSADDDDDVATAPSTTVAPSSSTETTDQPSTTGPAMTTAATTTTLAGLPPVETNTAIFPYASGTVRYHDPVDAARGFAVDFAGFTDPLLGDFLQGDARSGEVEIRPRPTVL
jgi:hypothetical protein